MKKFEYVIIAANNDLNKYDYFGSQGWELVSVDNGFAYFKREATLLNKLQSK